MIFDIKRFSVEDGPGVRSVVFLKGCPLRCVWCHNPESQGFGRDILFSPDKCIGCGRCVAACPEGCHVFGKNGRIFMRENCNLCGKCADVCFSDAIEMVGEDKSVSDIMKIVSEDKPFYGRDGGLTVSGGEPLAQFDFTKKLLTAAKAEGVQTALDTCGFAPQEMIDEIFPLVDLWLYDFKCADSAKHKILTGQPNELILSNLRRVDELGGKIILRCPLIPYLNDSAEDLKGIAEAANSLKNISAVYVEPYHPIGEEKYRRLGLRPPYTGPFVPKEKRREYVESIQALTKIRVK